MKKKIAFVLSVSMIGFIGSFFPYNAGASEGNVFFRDNSYSCDFEGYNGSYGWFDNYNLQIVPNNSRCELKTDIEGKGLGFSDVPDVAAYLQYNKFQSKDKLEVCFDIYFDSVPVDGFIATNGATKTGTRYMNNVIVEDGVLKLYSGNEIAKTYDLKEDTVYSVIYTIDNVSKKYSFLVNGEVVANNFSLYRNDVVSFNTIRIGMSYSAETPGNFCIDNFSFQDYILAEGDVFNFNDFQTQSPGLILGEGVRTLNEKDNSYILIPEKRVVFTHGLPFENTAVVAVKMNGKGRISVSDADSGEIILADAGSEFLKDGWNELIFIIDINNSCILAYNGGKLGFEKEIAKKFDFNNVTLKIEGISGDVYIDDIFLMTNDRAVKDFAKIFSTAFVSGKNLESGRLFAGELDFNVTVYDKREEKNGLMLLVHKEKGRIVEISSVPLEYDGCIGVGGICKNITYKRNDVIEAYLWTSASELIPLTTKTVLEGREEFKLYADEAEYAFRKKEASHPYIAVDKTDFDRVKRIYNSNENTAEAKRIKGLTESILKSADELCRADFRNRDSEYFMGFQDTNEYVLYIANKVIQYNEILGFAYQITGNEAYADCLYEIMHITGSSEEDETLKYHDWAPEHYLGTAQMTAAFAIGYDWGYNGFTDEERAEIQKSIYDYGVSEGLEGYRNNAPWAGYKNNWGMISNSGMILGSMALADNELYHPECFEVMAEGVTNIENVIDLFNEDGLWQESIGYGKESLNCLIRATDTLRSGLGNDYGLLSGTGLSRAADGYIYLDGPAGAYNFHDAGFNVSHINAYEAMWIGREFDNPELVSLRMKTLDAYSLTPTVWDILFYSEAKEAGEPEKDKYFNVAEMFSLRERNFDKNALWIGAQAGRNNVDHCHLDCGSFVLDWGGYRWAMDLGYDDYSLDGYFYTKRYNYYRVRAEGHNTLVINPSTEKDQKVTADTKVEKFVSGDDYSFAVMNLTDAYEAESVRRGIYMGDNRKSIVIRDELELNSEEDVCYWYMHTDANVNIINNIAYLTKGQKEMQLEFMNEGCDAVIDCVDAKALIELDGSENDDPNKGVKKIRIKLTNGKEPKLTVKITPVGTGNKFEGIGKVKSLDEWK